MSELQLENIMPPKKKLKTTNNESEDSKNMVCTDDKCNYCWNIDQNQRKI